MHEYPYHETPPQLAAKPEEMEKAIADCRASLPAETVFTRGLFEPLSLLGERDHREVSHALWWSLVSPATWAGVDLADAAAIRAVVERVAKENLALQPDKGDGASSPTPAPADPLVGMTPEQVRKALGRPDKKMERRRVHLPYFKERSACLAWQDRGPLGAWAWGEKVKSAGGDRSYEVQWVVFNREGKACANYEQTLTPRNWKAL